LIFYLIFCIIFLLASCIRLFVDETMQHKVGYWLLFKPGKARFWVRSL
jgi:hypothetical protein